LSKQVRRYAGECSRCFWFKSSWLVSRPVWWAKFHFFAEWVFGKMTGTHSFWCR
jgi:hypothetical protein